MALLESISRVAAAAHAPFITAAAPSLFDLDSFTDIGAPRDVVGPCDIERERRARHSQGIDRRGAGSSGFANRRHRDVGD